MKFFIDTAVALIGLLSACSDDGGPRLTHVTPTMAGIGASVTLEGDRFCGSHPDCTNVGAKVDLGIDSAIVEATITDYSATTATITIPTIAPAGQTELVLTVEGRSSNALPFTVFVP